VENPLRLFHLATHANPFGGGRFGWRGRRWRTRAQAADDAAEDSARASSRHAARNTTHHTRRGLRRRFRFILDFLNALWNHGRRLHHVLNRHALHHHLRRGCSGGRWGRRWRRRGGQKRHELRLGQGFGVDQGDQDSDPNQHRFKYVSQRQRRPLPVVGLGGRVDQVQDEADQIEHKDDHDPQYGGKSQVTRIREDITHHHRGQEEGDSSENHRLGGQCPRRFGRPEDGRHTEVPGKETQ